MNKTLNVGILGFGQVAQERMLPAIEKNENFELSAIGSVSLSKEKVPKGVNLYKDYSKLIEEKDLDVIYIALPNTMHTKWVLKSIENGKHVICEKPMTMSAKEIDIINSAAQLNSVKVIEDYMYRYSKRMKILENYLNQGIIGEITVIHSNFYSLATRLQGIRANKSLGGGALWDLGVYPLNLINCLLNPNGSESIVEISAVGRLEQEVDSHLVGQIQFSNGKIGSFGCGWVSEVRDITTILIGTKGKIVVEGVFNWAPGKIEIFADNFYEKEEFFEEDPFVCELEAFYNYVYNSQPLKMSLKETKRGIELTEMISKKMKLF